MTGEIDPYKFLWREEIDADYHCHIYLTKGTELHGWVQRGTTDVVMFSKPYRTWSPSRRKFRKLNRKEITSLWFTNTDVKSAA